MRKLTKSFMHFWISLVSVLALGIGWIFVAHAEKPAPLIAPQVQTVNSGQPVLEPIPSLDTYLQNGTFQAPGFQNSSVTVMPRLRTRGS
jgi:hypothetical protein